MRHRQHLPPSSRLSLSSLSFAICFTATTAQSLRGLSYLGDLVNGNVSASRNVALEHGATPTIHDSVRRVH
jgi:hypothetical protein